MLCVQCALCAVCRSIHIHIHIKAKIQIIDRRKKKPKKRNNEKYFHMFNKSCFELRNRSKALLEWFSSSLFWLWFSLHAPPFHTKLRATCRTLLHIFRSIASYTARNCVRNSHNIHRFTTTYYFFIMETPWIECDRPQGMRMRSTVNSGKWLVSPICFHWRNVSKF